MPMTDPELLDRCVASLRLILDEWDIEVRSADWLPPLVERLEHRCAVLRVVMQDEPSLTDKIDQLERLVAELRTRTSIQ